MNKYFACLILLALAGSCAAEEIDGEVNISLVDPYQRLAPGFCGSIRPDFLQWRGLSLGGGLALHISSRFKYETSDLDTITAADSTSSYKIGWLYFNENFLEVINFEFFVEGRWQFLGRAEDAQWKSWLTLIGGGIINSSVITNYQTQYDDSAGYIVDLEKYVRTFETQYRSEAYLSPGILIGIGNFIVGYRHWIIFNDEALEQGKPARMVGTLRLGYRFTW